MADVRKSLVSGPIKASILGVLAGLKMELQKYEANEEKIAKDAEEREKAKKEYEEAHMTKGDEKMQIFEE